MLRASVIPAARERMHAFVLRMALDTVDHLTLQIDKLTVRITHAPDRPVQDHPRTERRDSGRLHCHQSEQDLPMSLTETRRLDEIPAGDGHHAAHPRRDRTDMNVLPTADHLACQARPCPAPSRPAPRAPSTRGQG